MGQSGEAGAIAGEGGARPEESSRGACGGRGESGTRWWHERVVYSMGTIYHTMGPANGPGKWPHFLLMYTQNTASQKYAAGRIGPRHIKRNLNICMSIIQNAADLTPVE